MSFWASANSPGQGYAPGAQVGYIPRANAPAGSQSAGAFGPLAGGFGDRVPDPNPVPDETPEEVPDGEQELHAEQLGEDVRGDVERSDGPERAG